MNDSTAKNHFLFIAALKSGEKVGIIDKKRLNYGQVSTVFP
jgi:hypothetical protein